MSELKKILKNLNSDGQNNQDKITSLISSAKSPILLFGSGVNHHPNRGQLMMLINELADKTGAAVGHLTDGCNAAGAWLSGAVPHRGPCGSRLMKKLIMVRF